MGNRAFCWATAVLLTALLLPAIPTGVASAGIITYEQNSPDPFLGTNYTGAEDVWLLNNGGIAAADQNTGGDLRFIVGGVGGTAYRHGLMRFNLSSFAGKYSSIESVTLRFYWHASAGAADTVQVYSVSAANADWGEGVHFGGAVGTTGESTWLKKNVGGANWAGSVGASTPGVDYDNTLVASAAYTGAEAVGSAFDLTFTDPDLITNWLGANGGLYVRTASQAHQAQFRSSEYANFEPQLIINYTAVPEPSSFALVTSLVGGAWWKRRRRACVST